MAGTRTLKLKVLGDAKGAVQALGLVNVGMSSITKGVLAAGAVIAGSATAIGAFAYKAVLAGSAMQETQSKVNVVFGEGAQAVRTFASTAASKLGQSKQTALDAAATFGIFGKSAGLSGVKLAEFSTDFVALATDLASFNNTSPEMAIQAIGAALRGESEPLRRYGVLINDAALRQEALTLKIYNGKGALDAQQKILAAQALIYKSTGDAQGDFARTSDGLANQQRILKATITNLTETIGTLLLPYFQKVVQTLNKFLTPAVEAFSLSLDNGGSLGQAINFSIASLGTLGIRGVDAIEVMSMAVLNFIHDVAVMGETVAVVAGVLAALTGNVALTLKSGVAILALGEIRKKSNDMLAELPGKFDKWRQSIDLAGVALVNLKNKTQFFADLINLNEKHNGKVKATVKVVTEETEALKGAGAAVKTLAERLKDYRSAVLSALDVNRSMAESTERVKDAQVSLTEATAGIGKALRGVTRANDDVAKAIKNVAKAQETTAEARKEYTKTVAGVAQAQRDLTTATKATQKAQDAFNKAVTGYGANSKEGIETQKDFTEAQRNLEKSGYDLETAAFNVADAEKKLNEIRLDALSTPQMIREAEIDLAEAKLNLTEAQISQQESQTTLTEATSLYDQALNGVREDSKLYKELLDELNEAKKQEEEKILAVTTAREAEADALERIEESLDAEAEAVKGVEEARLALADAENSVAKAKEAEAKAARDLATAQYEEAKSLLAVAEAQKAVNDAKAIAGKMTGGVAGVAKVDASLASTIALANAAIALANSTKTQTPVVSTKPTDKGLGIGQMQFMAAGGVVNRATPAIIGERGPEAVIPLDRIKGFSNTYNITVTAGMGADGKDIGTQIVNALKRYERTNGAIPISVA